MLVSDLRLTVFFFIKMKFVFSIFILVIIFSLPFFMFYFTVAQKARFTILSFFSNSMCQIFCSSGESLKLPFHYIPSGGSVCRNWAHIIDTNEEAFSLSSYFKIFSRAISLKSVCMQSHYLNRMHDGRLIICCTYDKPSYKCCSFKRNIRVLMPCQYSSRKTSFIPRQC